MLQQIFALQRKTRGLFWETPVILDTAIENGVQSLGSPYMVQLPDGKILLTYFYHEAFAPNFSVSHKVWVSDDSGMSWQPLSNRDRENAGLSVTPQGTVVSLDWVDDGHAVCHVAAHLDSVGAEGAAGGRQPRHRRRRREWG